MIHIKLEPDAFEYVVRELMQKGLNLKYAERSVGSDDITLELEPDSYIPTKQEVRDLVKEYRDREADEYDQHNLRNKTPEQVDNYIDNNVTDLATAKTFLKALTKVILWLYKREVGKE